jgi:hypothetical protein
LRFPATCGTGRPSLVAGDAAQFHRAYGVDRFPQLLFFRDGRYVDRLVGFDGADKLRDAVAGFLGLAATGEPSAAEIAFRSAWARARARLEEIMRPASEALATHLAAVASEVDALERTIDEALAAYDATMADAVAGFTRTLHADGAGPTAAGRCGLPGQPFCA